MVNARGFNPRIESSVDCNESARASGACARRSCIPVGLAADKGRNRQPADDFRATARDRLDADIAAMQVDEVLHQGKTKPGATLVDE